MVFWANSHYFLKKIEKIWENLFFSVIIVSQQKFTTFEISKKKKI